MFLAEKIDLKYEKNREFSDTEISYPRWFTVCLEYGEYLFIFTSGSYDPFRGVLLNIAIILVALWQPFPFAAWLLFILSILVATGSAYYLLGVTNQFFISSVVGAGIFLITTILSTTYKRQVHQLANELGYQNQVIDSLTVYDRNTNLMQWRFAKRSLTTEMMRSKRYHGTLSLILFEVQQKSHFSLEKTQKIEKEMADIIHDVVREDIDIPFKGERIGLILPERDLSFSQGFASQIIPIMQLHLNAHISAGIANYPQDGRSPEEIIGRADEALQVALNSRLSLVAFQSLLTEEEKRRIKQSLEDTQEITKPVRIAPKRTRLQEYEKILRNIHCDEGEWIVWLKGFHRIEEVNKQEENLLTLEQIERFEFLYTQPQYLVLRIKTTFKDLIEQDHPFPGWVIHKINLKYHYLMISPVVN